MKILIASDFFFPDVRGGAEKSILEITLGLAERNHEVVVYSKSTANYKFRKNMRVNAIVPPLIDGIGKYLWPINDALQFFILFNKLKKEKPDVILTQQTISFIIVTIARILQIPCFHMIRDVSYVCPAYYGLIPQDPGLVPCDISRRTYHHCFYCVMRRDHIQSRIGLEMRMPRLKMLINLGFCLNIIRTKIYNAMMKYTRKIFVSSKMLLKFVSAHSCDASIVPMTPISFKESSHISSNVDSSLMNEKFKITKETLKLLIITTTNGNYIKGLDFLIEKTIPGLSRNIVLFVVGSKSKQNFADSRIIDLGRLNERDLSEMLSFIDILLVPSVWIESFGRVVVEGVFHGKPVFASQRVGALDDESYPFIKRLKLSGQSWISEIERFKPADVKVNNEDKDRILQRYSKQNCVDSIEKQIKLKIHDEISNKNSRNI